VQKSDKCTVFLNVLYYCQKSLCYHSTVWGWENFWKVTCSPRLHLFG